jgi:hypothetical protein
MKFSKMEYIFKKQTNKVFKKSHYIDLIKKNYVEIQQGGKSLKQKVFYIVKKQTIFV